MSCFSSHHQGIGGSLCYTPGIVIVGSYFDRLRPVAMGIATAGSGVGVFIVPPLLEYLFQNYSFFGAMLISGGFLLHNVISGALYRPLATSKHHTNEQEETKKSPGGLEKNSKCCCGGRSCDSSKYLDFRLLKSPVFLMYSCCLCLVTLSYLGAQMLVPPHAKDQGISDAKAAWLLSVIGISDTIGRVLSGFLFNMPVVKNFRIYLYGGAILISGLTDFLWAFSETYIMFQIVCIVHGLFNGAVISQRATIIVDLLGVSRLPSSFGLLVFVQGFGVFLGPAISGEHS